MPSMKNGKPSKRQHRFMEAIAHDPAFARKVKVPQKVGRDYVAADKAAGLFKRKDPPMAKSKSKGMMSESGMSPRKAMASGLHEADTGGSGAFGVKSFTEAQGHAGPHPDETAGTGRKGHMEDGDRAIGDPVMHTKGHHPAQAAPRHGPTHVDGYGMSDHYK